MVVSLIQIGISRGIRIPKSLLQQLAIEDKVELEVHEHELTIRPIHAKPHEGWAAASSRMHENGDDKLLIE